MDKNSFQEVNLETSLDKEKLKSLKRLTTVVYALQAASFLLGITFIVAVIINYVKKSDVKGTWLESHFHWQIRTFWFGILWGIIGIITYFFIIGWLILIGDGIWIIYRIVKGWLYLNDDKPMYK
jgi:uncharacterized membrane protein